MRHFDEARVCSKSVYYLEVLNMSVFGKVRVALGRVRHIFGVKINLNGSQSLIHSTLEIIRIIFFFHIQYSRRTSSRSREQCDGGDDGVGVRSENCVSIYKLK